MKKQSAFTLLEALITLTIISILAMITIPGLQELLRQAEDNAVKDDLLRIIKLAHTEAQLRQKAVTICHSSNMHSCDAGWSSGQIIFEDIARDGKIHHASSIISVNKILSVRGRIRIRFYPFYRSYIQFHPLQYENNDNGTIWYCRDQTSQPVWAIEVSQSGTTHVKLPDAAGNINDSSGKAFRC